jgi:hypothetical protein
MLRAGGAFLPALLLIGACGTGGPAAPPAPGRAAIIPMNYLVGSVIPDGDPTTPLLDTDKLSYRRQDVGGYQDTDAFVAGDGGPETTWSYPPFGAFNAANGDGGEHYAIASDGTVTIDSTQDGSQPGVQHFAGWLAFRADAAASRQCGTGADGKAYCYQRQVVTFPALGAVDSVIGEHYNTSDPASAGAMERSFWGLGWGRLVWQSWNREGAAAQTARCPDFGWNAAPQPGLVLTDCREAVTVVPADGSLTAAQLWHP